MECGDDVGVVNCEVVINRCEYNKKITREGYFLVVLLSCFIKRDLVRLAVFFLILPLPAALSRALMVEVIRVLASACLVLRALRDFLVRSLRLALILVLTRMRFLLLRNSFLAEALLGIN